MTWKWPIFQPCLITRGEAHDLTGQVLWVTKMAWFTPRNKISCLLFSGRRVLRGPSDASLFSIEIMSQPGIAELDFIFIYVPLIWNISSQSEWVSTLMHLAVAVMSENVFALGHPDFGGSKLRIVTMDLKSQNKLGWIILIPFLTRILWSFCSCSAAGDFCLKNF